MNCSNKTILLTGATGSFGTNFLRILLDECKPKAIRIYSRDEHKQTLLLGQYGGIKDSVHSNMNGLIGDVRDKDRLMLAMRDVDVVIHAAALKQVQSCEYNPFETIKTNILGSMNVVECALANNVEKVIGVSTDKAVNPLNLYGATKMCMEKVFINANNYRGSRKTKFCCTRYGNVASSRGTVVHLWRQFIINRKPLPITNTQATRFWISLDEANKFVMNCLDLMDTLSGGEIFVPKMPSIHIMDLYRAMTDGLSQFEVIGDRIGDKLHETLINDEEMHHTVDNGNIFIICPEEPKWEYHKPEGDSCAKRKSYRSDSNEKFLSIPDLKKILQEIK